jgi:hypothetical protein
MPCWLLAALPDHTAATITKQMSCTPLAVMAASHAHFMKARGSSRSTTVSAGQAVGEGEHVSWQLALPMLLTQVELLALAPPYLSEQLTALQQLLGVAGVTCNRSWQLRPFTLVQHWQPGQQPPNWRSFDIVQSQLQLLVASVWLQLGPALLLLCRRRSGEAVVEDEEGRGWTLMTEGGVTLGAASPREIFATFGELLTAANKLTGGWELPCQDRDEQLVLAAAC